MADIVYVYGKNVYINITNECPCRCVFCIRNNADNVNGDGTLWFKEHVPTLKEIINAIDSFDFSGYSEAVFCGYGEPTCEFDNLLESAKYLKNKKGLKVRLNTNGLSNLINGKETTNDICKNIDSISISLNAPTAEKYNILCKPKYGVESFEEIISFAQKCRENGVETVFTIVDIIPNNDIEECKMICANLQIPLHVRHYSK